MPQAAIRPSAPLKYDTSWNPNRHTPEDNRVRHQQKTPQAKSEARAIARSKGRRAWEIYTEAWWVNHPGVSPVAMLRPTLTTMTLVLGVGPYVVLAAGTSNGAVVSASGSVLSSFEIPVPPIQVTMSLPLRHVPASPVWPIF